MIEQLELQLHTPPRSHKSALGQFMTPAPIARFMASLLTQGRATRCKLLDAGAGEGALTQALLERWRAGELAFDAVEAHAWELDAPIYEALCRQLNPHQDKALTLRLHHGDFIEAATRELSAPSTFTHAILNPPYKKISAGSAARLHAASAGLEVVNLYAAFVGLALALLAPGGQLVAIIPRSFCNGPYYRPFRRWITERAALRRIHLFDSRTQPFSGDAVLQETVILHMERGAAQGDIDVSISHDATFEDLRLRRHAASAICSPDDPDLLIHIPDGTLTAGPDLAATTLDELGIKVSTGPVVDFRLRSLLRDEASPGCAPLLYPLHMEGHQVRWPIADARKPNAIVIHDDSRRWLYPRGHYCVVRRFSSKEERRRLVASVVPDTLHTDELIGFENHLNVFHAGKVGLSPQLAHGLTAYLTTSRVEQKFRQFNGHTQVNVTDLKALRYPSKTMLEALGRWAMTQKALTVQACDAALEALT